MAIIVHGGSVGERNFSVHVGHDLIKIRSCGMLWYTYMFTFVDENILEHIPVIM